MSKKISILIICACVHVSVFAQIERYGEQFDMVGDTFVTDDCIKQTKVIFIDKSKCIIKQKYYDTEIAKDYSIESEFRYEKEWTYETVKENDRTYIFYFYKVTLYPCKGNKGNQEPYIKLSDNALQRLNFSFCCPYTDDYYPDGERNCNRHIEDHWNYTPVVERDGYLINPSAVQIFKAYRINYQEYGIYNCLVLQGAPFEPKTLSKTDCQNLDTDNAIWNHKLAGKTYVIADNYRMERFAFVDDSLCTYSQFIPLKGDTIEVKQLCKYRLEEYYVALASYSSTFTDSIFFAMKNDEVYVCYETTGCKTAKEKYFPSSYIYFVNVIDYDTLMIVKDTLFYSKVFHYPDRRPTHFYRAYYPTTDKIYRFEIPYSLFGPRSCYPYPLDKCHLNHGNISAKFSDNLQGLKKR
ncbi:MAG: hypothetical protein MJZ93_07115 [Paludibacteraceae bacterium]|nr:hypothetical protein [Paludibacteraceae bacterium]